MTFPAEIRREYPFASNFYQLKSGHRMHYLDEGRKELPTILMVHGNPTWSFFYRRLVTALKDKFRIVVPDHLGMGLSDSPVDYPYCLQTHMEHLRELTSHLGIGDNHHLIVHDWGGAIALGMIGRQKKHNGKVVIMNSAAFLDSNIPFRIAICKTPFLGEQLIRRLNAFAKAASLMAVKNPLAPFVSQGFLWPYSNYQKRVAIARFVQDIPMKKNHPSYATLREVESNLSSIAGEKLLLWGMQDFCFTPHFLARWKDIYPDAKVKTYKNAGHYLLEDEPDAITREIDNFLS